MGWKLGKKIGIEIDFWGSAGTYDFGESNPPPVRIRTSVDFRLLNSKTRHYLDQRQKSLLVTPNTPLYLNTLSLKEPSV